MSKRSRKKKRRASPPPPLTPATSRRVPRIGWVALVALVSVGIAYLGWQRFADLGSYQSIAGGACKQSNLLFITIDTLRADRLGSYGSSAGLTPHLDRLATEGLRFDKVLAHVPMTLPSHTSIFSSMNPSAHGVHDNGTFRVDPSLLTLPRLLKDSGYRTAAFVGAFVLDSRFGLDQGFDHYDDDFGENQALQSLVEAERPAETVIASAEKWILESSQSPWFVWVHLFDPHAPYRAPPPFNSEHPEDSYGGEVAYVDHTIGSFLDRLEGVGQLSQSLVVVLGDHGESLGDHGESTHGTFAYNSTLQVPWILWSRECLRPQVFDGTVRHIDVMPTLLELVGVVVPEGLEGQSLRPFLAGERSYEPPLVYFEALNPYLTRDWAPLRGVVGEGFKLISLPIPELYNLSGDPEELLNVYESNPDLARRLERALKNFTGDQETVQPMTPDLETMERLRALGYVVQPVTNRKGGYSEEQDPKRLIHVSNAFDEAADHYAEGRPLEALAVLEGIVEKQPLSSQAYEKLAYILHQLGRLGEAVGVLETAEDNGVQEMSLVTTLGAYLLEQGNVPKARSLLEDLVRRHPDYAEGHNYLGIAYVRLGAQDSARQQFERVLELDPSSARALNNLGLLALLRRDFPEAVRLLSEAVRYNPQNVRALNGLGVAHAETGNMEASIESWKRVVELDPRRFDSLYNLAISMADHVPEEAVPYLERFVREAPPEQYGGAIAEAKELIRQIQGNVK